MPLGFVQLLKADPELARGIDPNRVEDISPRLYARVVEIERGPWCPADALTTDDGEPIGHPHRVDDRLLELLWCLAERWGRVVPDGVLVTLNLRLRTLASMIGDRTEVAGSTDRRARPARRTS